MHKHAVREKKKGRAKGGILTGVRKTIEEEVREVQSRMSEERAIKINERKWRIITVYRNEKGAEEEINKKVEEEREEKLLIMGDWNARIGEAKMKWDIDQMEERKSKDKIRNNEGEKLIKLVEDRGWRILNGDINGDEEGQYTYIAERGKSVIDYAIVNTEAEEDVIEMKIGTRTESDHRPPQRGNKLGKREGTILQKKRVLEYRSRRKKSKRRKYGGGAKTKRHRSTNTRKKREN